MPITQSKIDELKRDWVNDPIWDIEETEGFEEHREELLAFRLEKEKEWQDEREAERQLELEQARKIGVEGLYVLYKKQQKQIEKLTSALLLLTEDKKHEAYKAIMYNQN